MSSSERRKQNVTNRIQNAQEIRKQKKDEYVLKELQDQNTYLMEKLKYLNAHKTRNENEVSRLSTKNLELQKVRNDLYKQILPLMKVLKDWDGFRKEVLDLQQIWEEKVLELQSTSEASAK